MFNQEQARFSWSSLIIGILLVATGCFFLWHPDWTLIFLSTLAGTLSILKAIYEFMFCRVVDGKYRVWLIILGIIDLILGFIFIFHIVAGITILAYVFAIWIILTSCTELIISGYFKDLNKGYYWFVIVLNVITMFMGFILLFNPVISLATIELLIITYLIVIGIVKIVQAF